MKNLHFLISVVLILFATFFTISFPLTGSFLGTCRELGNGRLTLDGFEVSDECMDGYLLDYYCDGNSVWYKLEGCNNGCSANGCIGKEDEKIDVKEFYKFSEELNDLLEINENLGSVKAALTENDLDFLKGGIINTRDTNTEYNQYIRFKTEDFSSGRAKLDENSKGEVEDFLFFDNNEYVFEYELEFESGLSSEIKDGKLNDLEDKNLKILGENYKVIDAGKSGNKVKIVLMSGSLENFLNEGESKEFEYDKRKYKITLDLVEDDTKNILLNVNGDAFKLKEGDFAVLSDGVIFGINSVLTSEFDNKDRAAVVIGARKIVFEDTYNDEAFTTGAEINGRNFADGYVKIKASELGNEIKISSIKYRLKANKKIYVAKNHGLMEYLDDSNLMLGKWDIAYGGLKSSKGGFNILEIRSSGSDEYRLIFRNNEGNSYNIPYVRNNNGNLVFGDDNGNLYFTEVNNQNDYTISKNDYFVLTNKDTGTGDTNILRYKGINTETQSLTFEDLGNGNKYMTYAGSLGSDAFGSLAAGGTSYNVYVGNAPDYKIAVDQNADGDVNSDAIRFALAGARLFKPGASSKIITEKRYIEDASSDEEITISFSASGNDVGLSVTGVSLESIGSGNRKGLSDSGVDVYLKGNGDDPDELTFSFGGGQAGSDVAVVVLG